MQYKFPESSWGWNDIELLNEENLKAIINDEEVLVERKIKYENINSFCCAMVTGKDTFFAHYQALII